MLRRMKDMKDMVNAAPGMVAQAQQMGAQAQQMAAAQQAAQQAALQAQLAQAGGMQIGAGPVGPDFEPIDGVSLDQFAGISKAIVAFNYDQSKMPQIAASRGIPAFVWATAAQGWNDRIKRNPAVAQRFNQLYRVS